MSGVVLAQSFVLDEERDAFLLRRIDEHVERLRLVLEHRLTAAAEEHDVAAHRYASHDRRERLQVTLVVELSVLRFGRQFGGLSVCACEHDIEAAAECGVAGACGG